MDDIPDPTSIYWCWSDSNELLYVGMTFSCKKRFTDHKRDKSWWAEVASITVEHFPTRMEAHRAEIKAIFEGQPRFNCNHIFGNVR